MATAGMAEEEEQQQELDVPFGINLSILYVLDDCVSPGNRYKCPHE